MKKADVVVVTFNRLKLLKECIDSLLAQSTYISQVFVIDNNSTDGTGEFLKRNNNDILVSETLKKNVGGAKGFEYGVKKAMEKGNGDYIWIMDDDTIPQDNALRELMTVANKLHDDFGFLCSNVRWKDGSPTNIAHVTGDWPKLIEQGLVKVKAATFVSVLITKENVKKLGLPLGDMEIWGDDTEYTTRMSNYRDSYFVGKSLVIHKTAYNLANDSLKKISVERIDRYKSMYRNLIYIERKYGNGKKVLKMTIKNIITAFGALLAKNHKSKRFGAAIIGTYNGYFFNPTVPFANIRNGEDKNR